MHAKPIQEETFRTKQLKVTFTVLLAVLPLYLIAFLRNTLGGQSFSLIELLAVQPLFFVLGLWWLFKMPPKELQMNRSQLSPTQGLWVQDICVGFLLLTIFFMTSEVSSIWVELGWFERSNPSPQLLEVIRTISQNVWYTLLWLGPSTILAQLFLEYSRAYFLSSCWTTFQFKGHLIVGIIMFTCVELLLSLHRGPVAVLETSITSIVLNVSYYKYRRVLPLIVAGLLFRYLSSLGLWLH